MDNKVGIFNVAVCAYIEKDGKLLLLKRSENRDHSAGDWEMGVTGRVDNGESCEEALHREVEEETSLKIEIVMPFYTFHFYRGAEKAEHLGVSFWTKYVSGEVKIDPFEHSEYKWMTPEEAKQFPPNPSIAKELEKFIEITAYSEED